MIDFLKLAGVFAAIVIFVWLKKPLFLSMLAGIVAASLLFSLPPMGVAEALWKQTISIETADLLFSFYAIFFLQLMMSKKGRLNTARVCFERLLQNRRLTAIISSIVIGVLPSAAVMPVCANIVDQTCGTGLDKREKTFVSCYYRHIPEMFLPTFPAVLMAISLSRQPMGLVIMCMLPLVVAACIVVYLIFLRKIPRETERTGEEVSRRDEIKKLLGALWPLLLVLIMIIGFSISASIAAPVVILLLYLVDHFNPGDMMKNASDSFEPVMLGNLYSVMLFKNVLSATGVLATFPRYFAGNDPIILVLLFLAGTIISGSQAMIGLCLPLAMSAFPQSGIPILVMIMGTVWAGMEISPTHICTFVAADYFKTSFKDIVLKATPAILIFTAISYCYGRLLMLIL